MTFSGETSKVLSYFSPATREWFAGAFHEPTLAQAGAWSAIAEGKHALIVAPTGSGKTLAAFLWALDQLHIHEEHAKPDTKVLYISPLKALGVDVERNLRAPLIGIAQTAKRLGATPPEVSVGVRSGDTPAKERRQLISNPPDILITTPESLYLMLTSKARSTLANVHTVIIDEVHAVAGTKRGAHLAVTLERLDQILPSPAQRVGLSATVEPVETVTRFLGGTAPVEIVQPPSQKEWELKVSVPVPDMTALGGPNTYGEGDGSGAASGGLAPVGSSPYLDKLARKAKEKINAFETGEHSFDDGLNLGDSLLEAQSSEAEKKISPEQLPAGTTLADAIGIFPREDQQRESRADNPNLGPLNIEEIDPADLVPAETAAEPTPQTSGFQASIWPHVEERIVDLVESNRSTIVFANSRGLAEKLTARLNEIYTDRQLARGEAEGPVILARAHHGSVSKDQRTLIEEALKSGQLRCVVATSSLELGIDMGAVDLVVQVEAPPSVASGLQRVGRAGHQVGEVSRGYLYPKHRGDLLNATVTVKRMLAGEIEPLAIPTNPLDILAQQTVAAAALGPIGVETWFEALRNTAPFATLPRSAFEATLDLLTGKYPSDEFAELRPRLIWDRDQGILEPRPGAQRIAVTSGGTIPDRGLFPVFIVGSEDSKAPKRVGELDEEMVYESRAGDVIALGASSWRIEDISHDRVSVTPAPGVPGKLPFWHGEGPGRPVDLGRALGQFTRELAAEIQAGGSAARERLESIGLDTWAADNTEAYVREQVETTGVVPSDTQFVVERFRDEIGDWRVVLHSPFGMPVHAPWALAVGQRAEEMFGVNASAMAADDGIVLRIPAVEAEPPGADLFFFDPQELEDIVTERVSSSALFASRFRENAARALLLPRRDPGRRTPLWQQRQRSAQLLDVARKFPDFPIILETVRECLQDVYDLPALTEVHKKIEARSIRVSEIETETPSPFARTLLFGYVAQFLYEGDSPLAERRAAALSLDPALLSELLGRDELRELLDANVIRQTEARLQHTAPGYRYQGVEGVADLLRLLGPLTAEQLAARLRAPESTGTSRAETTEDDAVASTAEAAGFARELVASRRALEITLQGQAHFAAIEDAARLRDGLGVPLPMGVPLAFLEPVETPLEDLVGRYARTHAPFTTAQAAAALGLGTAVVETTLRALATDRRVISGEFLPEEVRGELALARTGSPEAASTEWVDTGVLRTLRARSLAALRADVEPVAQHIFGRFLPSWQHLQSWTLTEETFAPGTFGAPASGKKTAFKVDDSAMLSGYDGLLTAIDQIAGVRIPASALEPLVLRSRVSDYRPEMLDRALASGDVLWAGAGELTGDGWITLHLTEAAALTLPESSDTEQVLAELGPLERAVFEALGAGGLFFNQVRERLSAAGLEAGAPDVSRALWKLAWAGLVTNDTFAPVRSHLAGGHSAHKLSKPAAAPRSAVRRGAARLSASRLSASHLSAARLASAQVSINPIDSGRWSRLITEDLDPTVASAARAELLLDRYGVLTRGAVAAEDTPGGFGAVYRVLSAAEEKGIARRGYFIEELGAAQFSTATTVDRLRDFNREEENTAGSVKVRKSLVLLAATDPANPFGAALPWPEAASFGETASKHRPGRKAGAVVVLVDGRLALYLERGGRTVLLFSEDSQDAAAAAPLVAELVQRGAAEKIMIEKVNGLGILETPAPLEGGEEHPVAALRSGLIRAGFYSTPRGLRMRREIGAL
ncbi:DNA glycosylase AlkZ-like family protein [Rothia aerolata]|uniref:DEAD/DEAH box helicase n=1 Tax=Rothia aerolata TaxID=1812262 RepID=A0A917MUQ3_9MICC|nr:DEAD/DEAH box helicase [Rothia aerolata]GGH65320.1 DEAD/DEAH box helicase [Rothia aerolata]